MGRVRRSFLGNLITSKIYKQKGFLDVVELIKKNDLSHFSFRIDKSPLVSVTDDHTYSRGYFSISRYATERRTRENNDVRNFMNFIALKKFTERSILY